MLKDGIVSPERLVDITRLPLKWVTANATTMRVGAATTMEELAADPPCPSACRLSAMRCWIALRGSARSA
jgi:CO/xanthine dehydrogenase FAD-binding subunit